MYRLSKWSGATSFALTVHVPAPILSISARACRNSSSGVMRRLTDPRLSGVARDAMVTHPGYCNAAGHVRCRRKLDGAFLAANFSHEVDHLHATTLDGEIHGGTTI